MATSTKRVKIEIERGVYEDVKRASELRGCSMAELMRLDLRRIGRKILREAEAAVQEDRIKALEISIMRDTAMDMELARQRPAPKRGPEPVIRSPRPPVRQTAETLQREAEYVQGRRQSALVNPPGPNKAAAKLPRGQRQTG